MTPDDSGIIDKSAQERAISHDEPDDLQYIIHHASFPETAFSRTIDGALKQVGSVVSWFWLALMGVICLNVFMSNVLGQGSVRLEEVQWHIYAALFLIGQSYAMVFDDHIRVDILHERYTLKTKAWIETLGILVFLMPFLVVMLYYAWPFVLKAYADDERSISPAGLSHYWIIKSMLLVGLGLLVLSAVSRLHRCVTYLMNPSKYDDGGLVESPVPQQEA